MNLLNNRYQIIRELGAGGFGNTYLAEDTQMPSRRCCVIKQLKPTTYNPEVHQLIKERFAREAAVLEKLGEKSAQIPKLYAYFSERGQFYLVQEWIEGTTLTNKVKELGVLTEAEVKDILVSLLPVLDFVHSQGIVHRDIKPDNIILRFADRQPVLIDFGAVRETVATHLNSQGYTVSSIIVGTPGFMAVEQAAGRPVYSSDLYSLAVTGIYLLTGKMPQELPTDPVTGELIWEKKGLSQILASVLDKAARSHPRERFASAKEMLDALAFSPLTHPNQDSTSPPTIPVWTSSNSVSSIPTLPAVPPVAQPPPQVKEKKLNPVAIGILVAAVFIGGFMVLGAILNRNERSPQPVVSLSPNSVTKSPDGNIQQRSPAIASQTSLSQVFPTYAPGALSKPPQFARCFDGEIIYMVGEMTNSSFAICGVNETPPRTPTGYLAYDKKSGELNRAEFRNNRYFKYDFAQKRLYAYAPPNIEESTYNNPAIGVYRDGRLIQNVRILQLYKRE